MSDFSSPSPYLQLLFTVLSMMGKMLYTTLLSRHVLVNTMLPPK